MNNINDLNEGFFDTLQQFTKNATEDISKKWKLAKQQGDVNEMERIKIEYNKLRDKLTKMKDAHAKKYPNDKNFINNLSTIKKVKQKPKVSAQAPVGIKNSTPLVSSGNKQSDAVNKLLVKNSPHVLQLISLAKGKFPEKTIRHMLANLFGEPITEQIPEMIQESKTFHRSTACSNMFALKQ